MRLLTRLWRSPVRRNKRRPAGGRPRTLPAPLFLEPLEQRVLPSFIPWTYQFKPGPVGGPALSSPYIISADNPSAGAVILSAGGPTSAAGTSNVVATTLSLFSTAPRTNPATLTGSGAYQLTVQITDSQAAAAGAPNATGTLTFTGKLSGTFSATFANITNTMTGPTSQSLTLGNDSYTVSYAAFTPPGPPDFAIPGSIGFRVAVAPLQVSPSPSAGGPYTMNQGDALTLDATGTLNPGGVPLTYSWDVNGDGTFGDATGPTSTLTWSQLEALGINGPGTWAVRVQAADGQGDVFTSPATTLTVNPPPAAQITQPTVPGTGQVGLTLTVPGASPADQAAGFTYTVDWGDGTAQNPDIQTVLPAANNDAGVPVSHAYAGPGLYTVSVTATDKDGVVGPPATALVVVSQQAQDSITLDGGGSAGQVVVTTADEGSLTTAASPEQVLVAGSGGNDSYTVDFGSTLTTPIALLGSGSDSLLANGSSGDNNIVKQTGSTSTITWGPQAGNSVQALETVSYSGIAGVTINGGSGSNYIQDPGSDTTINGGPGQNTIVITATAGNGVVINGGGSDAYVIDLGSLAGPVTINNSNAGADDRLVVNGAAGDNSITLSGSQVTAGTQTINLNAPLASAAINGGTGNNQITVSDVTVPVQSLRLTGGGGNNTFTLANVGPDVGSLALAGGPGPGSNQVQVQGSLPADVTASGLAPVVTAGTDVTLQGLALARPGSFVDADAGASFSATVDYGDGTGVQALALNADQTFTLSHGYAAGGTFTVTVTGADGQGDVGTTRFAATVLPSIYVLNPTAAGALSLSGHASIRIPGLVQVDSSSATALSAGGNAAVTAGSIQVVGGTRASGKASLSPQPVTQAAALADPLACLAPPSSGVSQGSVDLSHGSLTINPGVYGHINVSGNASLILNPGVYILAGGGLSVSGNARVTGSGVLLYNAGSDFPNGGGTFGGITVSGNATVTLSAPTSGAYAGVVLFQARDNTRAISLGGNAVETLAGTVYAPAALLSLSGDASLGGSLVVNELALSGAAVG